VAIIALRKQKTVPPNGLVLFSGDGILHCFEPPCPMSRSIYRCGKRFHTEYVLNDITAANAISDTVVIVAGGNLSTIAVIGQSGISVLWEHRGDIPKKHGTGGQSAQRFSRARIEAIQRYAKNVAEAARIHIKPCHTRIVLSGSGNIKSVVHDELTPELRRRVVDMVDVQYDGLAGVREVMVKCDSNSVDKSVIEERDTIKEFERLLNVSPDRVVYGENELMQAYDQRAVKTVLIDAKKTLDLDADMVKIRGVTPGGTQFLSTFGIGAILYHPVTLIDEEEVE
jgi:peptide chain release factor subunit 1